MYEEQQNPQGQQEPRALTPQEKQQREMEEAYYYAGDQWSGRQVNDQALQVREATYSDITRLLTSDVFSDKNTGLQLLLTRFSRIPGITAKTQRQINRQCKDLIDMMHSEGNNKIIEAMMQELMCNVELLVSTGESRMEGLTGITAIATQNVTQKQEIRMPQQKPEASFLGSLNPWGKK